MRHRHLALVTLFVSSAFAGETQLSWTLPTTNADGTPLEDLAGINLFHGCQQSGSYDESTLVTDPTATGFLLTGLPDGETCYFVAHAYDFVGNLSDPSNEASKFFEIPPLPDAPANPMITWEEASSTLEITELSPPGYQLGTLAVGQHAYVDRGYTFTDVGPYGGATYVRTANDDRNGGVAVSFRVNQSAEIMVASDVRSAPPWWVTTYLSFTGNTIATDDAVFNVYSVNVSAGPIVMGDNAGTCCSMYVVIVR